MSEQKRIGPMWIVGKDHARVSCGCPVRSVELKGTDSASPKARGWTADHLPTCEHYQPSRPASSGE